jgi:endonuclease-3
MRMEISDYLDLVRQAKERLARCSADEGFDTGIAEAEAMLRDIEHFPHHFVLACLMDRQAGAARAWRIPYHIGTRIGGFDFPHYQKLSQDVVTKIFVEERLHRFHGDMAEVFYRGVQHIQACYAGDAKSVWANNPPAARVVRRFLEFFGVGIKIATMATNILYRQLKVPMTDLSAIDISPDAQVMKYLTDRCLLAAGAKREEAIYLAREIYPEYPGLLDLLAWEGGRQIKRVKPHQASKVLSS